MDGRGGGGFAGVGELVILGVGGWDGAGCGGGSFGDGDLEGYERLNLWWCGGARGAGKEGAAE